MRSVLSSVVRWALLVTMLPLDALSMFPHNGRDVIQTHPFVAKAVFDVHCPTREACRPNLTAGLDTSDLHII